MTAQRKVNGPPGHLRRALIDLGTGLWHQDPAARACAGRLLDRGKPGKVIGNMASCRVERLMREMGLPGCAIGEFRPGA